MSVLTPPRPPAPGAPREALERRREQEALIKEARRRARQRRQCYAALALLGLITAVAIGPAADGGGLAGASRGAGRAGVGAGPAGNGKIAFVGSGGLQLVEPDGTGARVVEHCRLPPRGCELGKPAWSPDGKQLAFVRGKSAFVRSKSGGVLRAKLSLYVKDLDRGRVRRLARCGSCGWVGSQPSWSPDSSRLVVTRDSLPTGQPSLWIVDTSSGELRRLTDCRQFCADRSPDWAPTGDLIAFRRVTRGAGTALYTVRADGSQLTKITNSPAAGDPRWSPDGREIAFVDHDSMYTINADGSDRKLLVAGTRTPGEGPGHPVWSPDGTKLAFLDTPRLPNRRFAFEVWTITSDGLTKRRVYRSRCCVGSWAAPIWSPDGKQIAFSAISSSGTFFYGTYVTAADGRGLHQLSPSCCPQALSWQRLP